jgi:hypothetical protein
MTLAEKIILALQFEIPRPASYGPFHLICLAISAVVLVLLVTRKHSDREKTLKTVLLVYGIGALVLEAIKQIIWSYSFDPAAQTGTWDYQWYAFPFQLCTTPIFASLICAFLKESPLRRSLLSYMAFFTILGSLATAVYPESCFVRTALVDVHTMYLHLGSLVVSLWLLLTGQVKTTFRNLQRGFGVFLVFVLLAEALNLGLYHAGILGDETFNMFYISPYFISSLPVFDVIQQKVPFAVFLLLYLIAIFLGASLVWLIARGVGRLTAGKKQVGAGV